MRLFYLWLFFFATLANAESVPHEWELDANASTLMFVFTHAGSVQRGEFKSFNTQFSLDPTDIEAAHIEVVIDLDSLDTGDPERDQILRSDDLFAVERWSQAIFRAMNIREQGENQYLADATLTIRDETRSLPFPFMLELQDGGNAFRLQAALDVNRLDFGVGQGNWASGVWAGKEVNILVDVVANNTRK